MTRRENDFYPTPARATEVLLEYAPEILKPDILEPCAGDGAIADILAVHGNVITGDIDTKRNVQYIGNACTLDLDELAWMLWGSDKHGDWSVITNPPFNLAPFIVPNFVNQKVPCAFLLRLTFLEPVEKNGNRGPWLKANPPAGVLVLPRISFTGDGKTDSVTCAWMCWNIEPFGVKVIDKEEFRKCN